MAYWAYHGRAGRDAPQLPGVDEVADRVSWFLGRRETLRPALAAFRGRRLPGRGALPHWTERRHAHSGYQKYNPGAGFLGTKVYFSSGTRDRTSPLLQQNSVRASMQRTGFNNIRAATFAGPHTVKRAHFAEALRWFRQ